MDRSISERERAEDVGSEPLLSVLVLQGLAPVGGGELEDAGERPSGQETEEIAEIGPGFDLVELAAGQERHEDGVGLGTVVTAAEEPVLAADSLAAELSLGEVVVDWQAAILEESRESLPLVERGICSRPRIFRHSRDRQGDPIMI